MRVTVRGVATTCLALAGAGALGWLVFVSPYLRFHTLVVEGNTRASTLALTQLAGLPVDAPLATIDLDSAVAAVAEHPWVAHAEASRRLPDTIVLHVEERVAAGVLHLDHDYLVDEDGRPFTQAGPGDLDQVFVTGLTPELAESQPALSQRLVHDGLALARAVVGHGGIQESDVSEVHFDTESGYSLLLRNGGRLLVGFDGADHLDRLDQLARSGLDLSLPHRIDLAPARLAVVSPL